LRLAGAEGLRVASGKEGVEVVVEVFLEVGDVFGGQGFCYGGGGGGDGEGYWGAGAGDLDVVAGDSGLGRFVWVGFFGLWGGLWVRG
jgi:hypothetical protein